MFYLQAFWKEDGDYSYTELSTTDILDCVCINYSRPIFCNGNYFWTVQYIVPEINALNNIIVVFKNDFIPLI